MFIENFTNHKHFIHLKYLFSGLLAVFMQIFNSLYIVAYNLQIKQKNTVWQEIVQNSMTAGC